MQPLYRHPQAIERLEADRFARMPFNPRRTRAARFGIVAGTLSTRAGLARPPNPAEPTEAAPLYSKAQEPSDAPPRLGIT
jgi:hypothetical protein